VKPPTLARIKKSYDWLLNPYLQHLQDECGFSAVTLRLIPFPIELIYLAPGFALRRISNGH
jgi:hypothetical protein